MNEALTIDPENEAALNFYHQIREYIVVDEIDEDLEINQNDEDDDFEGGGAADDN